MIEWKMLSIKIFLAEVTLKVSQEKYSLLIVLKINPRTYKIKDLNGEK